MSVGTFGAKQSSEKYFIEFDFTNLLGSADISSADVSAVDGEGEDATATITVPGDQVDNAKTVDVKVYGGLDGVTYKITCVVTAADGSIYELDGNITVTDT